MVKQIFQIISGGRIFSIQNNGKGTCVAIYQGGFVLMGGCCPYHGKVDRWAKTVISESPFPSQIRLGRQLPTRLSTRPSGRKKVSRLHHVHIFRRRRGLIPKFACVLILIPRACWSPEVSMVVNISQEPSCTCRQRSSGREEKIFPGILNPNLYHHHQRMIIICRCMQFCSLVDCLIVSCFGDFDLLLSAVFDNKYQIEIYGRLVLKHLMHCTMMQCPTLKSCIKFSRRIHCLFVNPHF